MKRFCNLVVLICAVLVFSVNTAFAGDFSKNTSNAILTSALNKLESINKYDVLNVLAGDNPTGKPIKVMFRNLAVYGHGNCEAITAKTNSGNLVILINNIHEDAPVEAIACLIAHESVHNTTAGTFDEELRAWTMETMTWIAFTNQNPALKDASSYSKLVKRENYIAKLYTKDGNQTTSIENLIASNSAYQNLK